MLYMFSITFHRSLVYLIFSREADFTHAIQDQDHGALSSQRVTMTTSDRGRCGGGGRQHHLSSMHSTSSMHTGSESSLSYAHGYSEYLAPDPSTMCIGCMSGRIWISITCWCLNGKQLSHGRGKLEKSTR
jgi:hypothetical protein